VRSEVTAIRVGVLTPHAAIGPEAEFPAIAPGRVLTCVARVSTDTVPGGIGANAATPSGLRALTTPPFLDETTELLGQGGLDAIVYASTSSAYALGFGAEAALVSRLSEQLGIPVLATCASAVRALRALDVQRIAIVDPPWFDDELNELGAAYFRSAGFDVLSSSSAALSQDPGRIDADALCEWASGHVGDDAEAVFIGGNGFRAAEAIAALEAAIGRPVLTSNQVLLWNVLIDVGATFEISGYGRLFAHRLVGARFA
jgi:maleate isomerase